MNEETFPHSDDTESAVLGALFIDPEAIHGISNTISADDFYHVKNGWIYDALLYLSSNGKNVDYMTVTDELARRPGDTPNTTQLQAIGGQVYLTSIINKTPSALHVADYAETIFSLSTRRRMLRAAAKIAEIAGSGLDPDTNEPLKPSEMLSQGEAALLKVMERTDTADITPRHYRDVLNDIMLQQVSLAAGERVQGIDPLLPTLRKLMPFGVYQKGWTVGIGANPKMGKSLYALNVIVKALVDGKNVMLIGTEMMNTETGNRMVPMLTSMLKEHVPEITTQQLLRQLKSKNDTEGYDIKRNVIDSLALLLLYVASELPGNLLIVDEPLSVSKLRLLILRAQIEYGMFDLIVVDHIGMMIPDGNPQSETQKMNQISGDLLVLSKTKILGKPTMLFVSPFTKGLDTELPGMHRFRDTFMLAHNAHVLLGMYLNEDGHKCIHLAGMRASNAEGISVSNIPVSVSKDTGLFVELTNEKLNWQ